ncbi:ice-binding family protein [Leifsonia aquatica]|uniref:ice-binding family protein n=1 Tax=Leifsonia aquatica TaxID=144185 RepID=UPI0028ABFB18|nr:ice-binding family protein [Leifsonia aquatica]
MPMSTIYRNAALGGAVLTALILFAGAQSADAATTIDGPVGLGTAASYGALGASELTNTGPTVVTGDIGVSPGSSVTGFTGAPDGTFTGSLHQTDAAAAQAQSDVTTAFNAAAGLTPTTSGLSELNGLSLVPGVYSGGALALADNGVLTLAGSADSVWVFQAASSLTIGSATQIIVTGGANACNVFWEIGSSASLGTGAQFQGTILAKESITATTGATIIGRLLANTAAVTLDTNTITVPTGCTPPGTVSTSPTITSGTPTAATAGTPYSYPVTATGSPAPTYTVTNGSLPAGLTLNGTTGVISGTPTTPGSSTFTITVANGTAPDTSATYTIETAAAASAGSSASTASGAAELADTGGDVTGPLLLASLLAAAGAALVVRARRPSPRRH